MAMGFIFIQSPDTCLYAQRSMKSSESKDNINFLPSIRKLAAMENPAITGAQILGRNYVNTRAIRDFLERYDKVENAMWFSTPEGGFETYFVQDGFGERVFYDGKGYWRFSLIMYSEKKLPRNIRASVKSIYYDLDITMAEEVQTTAGVEYVVYMEDELHIVIVKVSKDGEIEVLQNLDK